MKHKIRIGTRGSQLALYQAELTQSLLRKAHPGLEVEIVRIRTRGDQSSEPRTVDPFATKRVFTKEIEDALLREEVDVAVHSAKDVATLLPEGLEIAAVLEREDVRDCLLSRDGKKREDLPEGARIGTSSLRRKRQLAIQYPHFEITDIRGNVDTRIKKMTDGEYDAVVLALAGLKRIRFTENISEIFSPEEFLPSPGQGAILVQTRSEDHETRRHVASLDHAESRMRLECERAFLRHLEGGCQLPCGIWTSPAGHDLHMTAGLFAIEENKSVVVMHSAPSGEPAQAGIQAAEKILHSGGDRIIAAICRQSLK